MPEDTAQRRRFVVGLGNPGRRYAGTRHNVGFLVVEGLRRHWGLDDGRSGFQGRVTDGRAGLPGTDAPPVTLLEPATYMNRSGQAVAEMVAFYKASPGDVLVVMDDMALEVGRLRFRSGGSAGGHNGLDDILRAMGTRDVPRLRIGIGQPPGRMDPADYVLGRFGGDEREAIDHAVARAVDAVDDWIARGSTYVMDKYNRRPAES